MLKTTLADLIAAVVNVAFAAHQLSRVQAVAVSRCAHQQSATSLAAANQQCDTPTAYLGSLKRVRELEDLETGETPIAHAEGRREGCGPAANIRHWVHNICSGTHHASALLSEKFTYPSPILALRPAASIQDEVEGLLRVLQLQLMPRRLGLGPREGGGETLLVDAVASVI